MSHSYAGRNHHQRLPFRSFRVDVFVQVVYLFEPSRHCLTSLRQKRVSDILHLETQKKSHYAPLYSVVSYTRSVMVCKTRSMFYHPKIWPEWQVSTRCLLETFIFALVKKANSVWENRYLLDISDIEVENGCWTFLEKETDLAGMRIVCSRLSVRIPLCRSSPLTMSLELAGVRSNELGPSPLRTI